MDSWEARAKQLNIAITDFWYNLISIDAVKTFISSLTEVVNILDTLVNNSFSSFLIQVGLLTSALTLLGIGFNALKSSTLGVTVGVIALNIAEKGLIVTTRTLTTALLASPLFWTVAVSAGLVGIIKLVDKLNISFKEQQEIVANLSSKLSGLQTELEQLKTKTNRTEQEEKYLKILIEQEKNLKNQLALQTKLLVQREYMSQNTDYDFASDDMLIGYFDRENTNKIEEAINNIKKYNEEISNLDDSNENAKETIDDLNLKITQQKDFLIEQYTVIQGYAKALEEGNEKDTEHYKILVDFLNIIDQVINKTEESTDAKAKNNKQTQSQLSTIEKLQSETEKYASSMELLNKAEKELNTENEISSATLSELLEKYPEIIEQTGLQKDKILELITAKKQESASFIEEEKRKTNKLIDQVQKRLEVYQKELEKIDSVYSAVWLTHVESGAMSESEYQKRLSLSKGLLGTTISRDKDELDRLRNRLSFLNYIQNNLGRIDSTTSASSPASPYESKLDDYLNTLQLIEEKQQEINKTQKQRDLALDEKKVELIQKEIALQQDLIKLNESLLSQQQQTRQSLADQLSAYSDVVTVADDLETLSVDTDKYNKLSDKQKESLDNLISSFTNLNKSINSSKNAMLDAEVAVKNLNDEITKINENIIKTTTKSISDSIATQIKALQKEQKSVIDSMEESLDRYEKRQQNKIDKLKEELEILQKQNEEEDRRLQLAKLQEEIENTLNNKNIRTLKRQADGTWDYVYTYDEEKYSELINQREELLTEYRRKDIIKAKQDEIKALEDATRKEIRRQKDEIEKTKKNYEQRIADYQSFKDKLSELQNLTLEEMKISFNSIMDELKSFTSIWNEYADKLKPINATIGSSISYGGSSGGSRNSYTDSSGKTHYTGGNTNDIRYEDNPHLSKDVVDKVNEARDKLKEAGLFHKGLDVGMFAGNIPFDPKTEAIAKLLKGEIVMTKPQFHNIIPNLFKGLNLPSKSPVQQIFQIDNISLPNVTDGNSFIKAIKNDLPRLALQSART